jgi:hypothetical protein
MIMCEISELRAGQTAGWDDLAFGGTVTGTIEYISISTGWVTVKLNGPHTRGLQDGSSTLSTRPVTHTTLRAASLTLRD